MKGYYLFAPVEPECTGPESGVERKVRAQCKALNQYLDCELVVLPPVEYTGSIAEKIIRRLPYTAAWRKWKYNGEFDDADFLYIRQVYHDQSFYRYLKAIRRSNPSIKLIYEVPTYPFESSKANRIKKRLFSYDPYSQKRTKSWPKICKQFDRIATFYGQKSIVGVPCIAMINGYDFSQTMLPERHLTGYLSLISVSSTAYWHGYDRIIEGMHQYYENGGTEQIVYHLVGNILPDLQKMVQDHHLEDHVIFHGLLYGKALSDLYAHSTIGIDVLAGHRKNYPISSSLKSREYCAYGLPIITSSPVDFLPADSPYQLIVPYDDSPIDVPKLIEFCHTFYQGKDPNLLAAEIRSFAERNCDMSITMKPIADWLLGGNTVDSKVMQS